MGGGGRRGGPCGEEWANAVPSTWRLEPLSDRPQRARDDLGFPVCPGELVVSGYLHGDAQLVVGYVGLVFRRKMWPEDVQCMSVPEFSWNHSWRPLFPGSWGAPPALWAASATQGWHTPSQHTILPSSLSACAAVQGGGAWDALPGSVPTRFAWMALTSKLSPHSEGDCRVSRSCQK